MHLKTVSIIIPVFNDLKMLKGVIPAIYSQTYPQDMIEIIVVDNGSEEDIESYCKNLINVQYISEDNFLGSPYSCRNRGIEKSSSEVIILLDATCIPKPNWLEFGIACLVKNQLDIVGGNVQFGLSKFSKAAEIVDAMTSVRMEWSIRERRSAYTANLFILRELFLKYGMFPEGLRSGGDVRWTKSATTKGASIGFCAEAVVEKKARTLYKLIQKKWRTSKNQTLNWINEGKDIGIKNYLFAFTHLVLLPKSFNFFKNDLKKYPHLKITLRMNLKLWLTNYSIRVVEGVGIIYGGLKYNFKKFEKSI